jgi:chromosome segregation ATPase
MKRTTSNKVGKTRQAASKAVKRPVTPVAVSAVKQKASQIRVAPTQNRGSAKTSRTTPKQRTPKKRTGTIISMAAPSPLERVVLAKQEKITALSNQLTMKDREIEELMKENKLLRTVQYRQEKALDRFQNAEADLPQLVNRHAVEMMALKQRLKKSQDGLQVAEHKLREQNEEMWKLKVMLNEVTKLSGDKHLLERDRLRQMLNKANEKLEEKTKRANVSTHNSTNSCLEVIFLLWLS